MYLKENNRLKHSTAANVLRMVRTATNTLNTGVDIFYMDCNVRSYKWQTVAVLAKSYWGFKILGVSNNLRLNAWILQIEGDLLRKDVCKVNAGIEMK